MGNCIIMAQIRRKQKKHEIDHDKLNSFIIRPDCSYIVSDTNSNYDGYHRSGWKFVMDAINQNNDSSANMLLDPYIDSTFLWRNDELMANGTIPYNQQWVGIMHHTENTSYSENNAVNIIKNSSFIASLPTCKCIIVMSKHLQQWLRDELHKLNYGNVEVHYLCHPTMFVPNMFTIEKFRENKEKRIIQIGGWMRDIYGIYKLYVAEPNIKKTLLKWKGMDCYLKPNHINIIIECDDTSSSNICGNICETYVCQNKYIEGLLRWVKHNEESVDILENINNMQYDDLLASNIVFIELIDVAACNTIVECIVRNTPIIVNRLAGAEELLGHNYPLFYNTIEEASMLANRLLNENDNLMMRTYNYLNDMDKSKFKLDTFMTDFQNMCCA